MSLRERLKLIVDALFGPLPEPPPAPAPVEEGRQVVSASLPAVVGTTKGINEPRLMTFMGIRKAARMEYPQWTADQLGSGNGIGAELEKVGLSGSGVRWPEIIEPPVREGEVEMIEGETGEEAARRLVDRLIAEKVF